MHEKEQESRLPLFFQKRLFPLWISFTLGVFTDNTLKQALLIGLTFSLITVSSHVSILPGVQSSPDIVPYAGAIFALAMVLFSPIAGQIADKYTPLKMFRLTKAIEVVLMIIAAFGFLTNNGWLLMMMLFAMGIQSAFYSPARISSMPKYLNANELVRGNAFFNGGLFVANSLAYAIGGALIVTATGPQTIAIILLVAAGIGMLSVFFIPERPAAVPELAVDFNLFRQYAKMVGYVKAEPPIIRPLFGAAVFFFCATAVTVNVPYYARDILHGDGQVATAIMVCFTLGSLIGAGIAASLSKGTSGLQFSAKALLLAILITVFVFVLSIITTKTVPDQLFTINAFLKTPLGWPILISFTLTSAATAMYIVPLQAAVQRRALPDHRARLMASGNILNAAAAFIGALSVLLVTAGLLAPHTLLLAIALMQLAVFAYMVHRRRSVPEGLYDEMLRPSK